MVRISSQKMVQIHICQLKNSSRTYWLPTVCESHSHSSWTLFVCVSCDLLAFFFMFVWINPAGKWKTTFTELLQTLSSQHTDYMLTTQRSGLLNKCLQPDHIWLPWKEFQVDDKLLSFPIFTSFFIKMVWNESRDIFYPQIPVTVRSLNWKWS